ncbi:GNAT family N-acetyltransferase [Candidatus Bipolaricaulota bacterium]
MNAIEHELGSIGLAPARIKEIAAELPQAVLKLPNALLVLERKAADAFQLHWAADSPEALAAAVATLMQQIPSEATRMWKITLINQAAYVDVLLPLGFKVHSHYLDHWLADLPSLGFADASIASIREAQETDVGQLAVISKACAAELGWIVNSVEWYNAWQANADNAVLVAEISGSLAGLCCVRRYGEESDKIWIRELAVAPDHRRTGLGRSLLNTGLRWGRDRGAARAFLAVDARSTAARCLYTSVGFLPSGEEELNLIMKR